MTSSFTIGGENIYPLEVEERLAEHPSVARAIVVGIKDDHYGEVVGAFLEQRGGTSAQTRPQDDDIRAFTRLKLGRHKAPTHIFWFGDEDVPATIPLTGSGKVKKFEMAKTGEEIVRRRMVKTVAKL